MHWKVLSVEVCRHCTEKKNQVRLFDFNYSTTFIFLVFGGHESFLWGHWYPCFGLLMTSPLGFKGRVDPSLVCFVTCVPWNPEIHLWIKTFWLYRGQHGSQSHSLHGTCSRGRLPGFNWETSRTVSGHAVHSATATGFYSTTLYWNKCVKMGMKWHLVKFVFPCAISHCHLVSYDLQSHTLCMGEFSWWNKLVVETIRQFQWRCST